ncbi:MIB [Mytilus edulis]|uniref:MIB n=1 Tax=Mytilus edulis TaxID=6550 RepID=A0A8S3QLE3_MYTED|nr:MIB [Mytilus edulis]
MTAVSSSKDDFKTETSNISPGETSRTSGFDDIGQAQPDTKEHDYLTYDLISVDNRNIMYIEVNILIDRDSRRTSSPGLFITFLTFAGERITDRYAGEKIKQHSRVVKTSWSPKEDMQLGTIVKVKKSGKEVLVQWDKIEEKVNLLDLRLVAATEKLKQGSRVVKKSWIPKEEKPLGTITMVKTLRREVYVNGTRLRKREKEEGSRVVKIVWKSEDKSYVGTIVKINIPRQTACVRWDKQPDEKVQLYKLRLIGNYLTGVKHTNVTCDECYTYPLRGIRWKCLHCDSYDLCTVCYMADEHNVSHIFSRIQSEDSKGKEMPARFDVTLTGYAFALGIQENAEVSLRKDNRKRGVVLAIRDFDIEVQWLANHIKSQHNILELQCENTVVQQFYPDHLLILGKGFASDIFLVGCKILQDASDDKKNEQIQRETSQRLKTVREISVQMQSECLNRLRGQLSKCKFV